MAFDVLVGDERERFRTEREAIIAFCEYLCDDAGLAKPRYPVGTVFGVLHVTAARPRRWYGTRSGIDRLSGAGLQIRADHDVLRQTGRMIRLSVVVTAPPSIAGQRPICRFSSPPAGGDLSVCAVRFRCRDCGMAAEVQVRPPMPGRGQSYVAWVD
jgi:hypothetical protein